MSMALTPEQLKVETLKLPMNARAKLAQTLLLSLDKVTELENENLWIEEAERRYQELQSNEAVGRPAADVFDRIRASMT
jgi:hypothetical protein